MDHNVFEYGISAVIGKASIENQCYIGGSGGLFNFTPNKGEFKHLLNQNIGITTINVINGGTAPLYNLVSPGAGYWVGNTQQAILGRWANELGSKK